MGVQWELRPRGQAGPRRRAGGKGSPARQRPPSPVCMLRRGSLAWGRLGPVPSRFQEVGSSEPVHREEGRSRAQT